MEEGSANNTPWSAGHATRKCAGYDVGQETAPRPIVGSRGTRNDAYINQPTLDPGDHDVLLGRGGETNNHSGNFKFRKLIAGNQRRYREASKSEKPNIAKDLVKIWRSMDPPGRFLSKIETKEDGVDGATACYWLDVGDKLAQKRTSKSLGEKKNAANHQHHNQITTSNSPTKETKDSAKIIGTSNRKRPSPSSWGNQQQRKSSNQDVASSFLSNEDLNMMISNGNPGPNISSLDFGMHNSKVSPRYTNAATSSSFRSSPTISQGEDDLRQAQCLYSVEASSIGNQHAHGGGAIINDSTMYPATSPTMESSTANDTARCTSPLRAKTLLWQLRNEPHLFHQRPHPGVPSDGGLEHTKSGGNHQGHPNATSPPDGQIISLGIGDPAITGLKYHQQQQRGEPVDPLATVNMKRVDNERAAANTNNDTEDDEMTALQSSLYEFVANYSHQGNSTNSNALSHLAASIPTAADLTSTTFVANSSMCSDDACNDGSTPSIFPSMPGIERAKGHHQ